MYAKNLCILENPFMREDTGTQFHTLIVSLEEAAVIDEFIGPVPIQGELHSSRSPTGAAWILPAVAIDIDFERPRIESHFSSPIKQKRDGRSRPPNVIRYTILIDSSVSCYPDIT